MKTANPLIRPRQNRLGISLVIVLGSLVFLSALVVAFLVQMSTELKSSKMYAEGASARILAQSATNMVMGQIQAGTRGIESNGNPLAWASQPGLIRTYDITGGAKQSFKLYSDSEMVVPQAFDPATAAAELSQWHQNKALYTDLNQPVASIYPIFDPQAQQSVLGFSVNGAPVESTAAANPAPMPVKWLYVLANGRVVAPTGTGNTALVAGADQSPIVGRIAFWTDDETCKVNINTASEGSYSDVPRVVSAADAKQAANQPVRGEYQRYPGHPATTSLSAVFPSLLGALVPPSQTDVEKIYGIVPRIKGGGSLGGSALTTRGASVPAITPDADRLFASVDELVFQPDRDATDAAALTPSALEQARFFLTTSSRAPEINLHNKPRVCIWPIHQIDDAAHRTPYDNLIAFCSTMRSDLSSNNRFRYYFTRDDPYSPTKDLPTSKSTAGLERNRMLLEYLRHLTKQRIPGFGGAFSDKYSSSNNSGKGTDNDQILTQVFDYIRATNLSDSSVSSPYTVALNANKSGAGQVIPIEDNLTDTRGFGRFRTVQGGSLLFIASIDGNDPNSQVTNFDQPLAPTSQVPPGRMRVQAIFLLQLYDPSVGSIFNNPNFKCRVDGLDQFKWNDVPMGFPGATTQTVASFAADGAFFGDQTGFRQLTTTATVALISNPFDLPNPPSSSPPPPPPTFGFTGGDVTISLLSPSDTIVQTVVLNFPNGIFPVPKLGPDKVYNYDPNGQVNSGSPGPYNLRFFNFLRKIKDKNTDVGRIGSKLNASTWILDQDVIRSITPRHGDMRLIAAQKNTPRPGDSAYPFGPNAKYHDTSVNVLGAHNLFTGNGEPYYGAAQGRLVKGINYDNKYAPINLYNKLTFAQKREGLVDQSSASDAPVDGVALGKKTDFQTGDVPGDWDNAPYGVRDGPFINKPDEGDMGSAAFLPYNWEARTGNFTLSSTLFTPNRLIPSAITFGSLPTGVFADRPWQTLLFRPDPAGTHPGSKDRSGDGTAAPRMPADHLLLDLFTMPVVEPYAISEPLSTAGKVNMNYQIIPFAYITRSTAIQAVLKSEKVIAIPDAEGTRYKDRNLNPPSFDTRFDVNISETLKGFENKFSQGEIFRSATEICELPIVPAVSGGSYDSLVDTGLTNFWNTHRLTGDNSRERPYATIYPRLTTKSNTYTIHVRAQVLKKSRLTPEGQWIEGRDQVVGEYRGSQLIERFVDPNNKSLPDYADINDPDSGRPIGDLYKFRVISAKQFAP